MNPSLLRIDSSARQQSSTSRRLADAVEQRWLAAHPGGRVLRRDLALNPVPHIEQANIEGYYTPAAAMTPRLRAATALSDSLIAELKAAHTLLIAAPIYNFSLPSSLKAWIDQIVRIGATFAYQDGQFSGLVQGPRAVLALAYGAAGYQGELAGMDHLRPYLTALLGFIGIQQVDVVAAEASTTAQAAAVEAAALAQVPSLFAAAPQALAA